MNRNPTYYKCQGNNYQLCCCFLCSCFLFSFPVVLFWCSVQKFLPVGNSGTKAKKEKSLRTIFKHIYYQRQCCLQKYCLLRTESLMGKYLTQTGVWIQFDYRLLDPALCTGQGSGDCTATPKHSFSKIPGGKIVCISVDSVGLQ